MLTLYPLLLLSGLRNLPPDVLLNEHGRKGGHTWRLRMRVGFLDVKLHRLGISKWRDSHGDLRYDPTVDGIRMSGDDDDLPGLKQRLRDWRNHGITYKPFVLKDFSVSLDDHRVSIPKKLWQDLLDPGVVDLTDAYAGKLTLRHVGEASFQIKLAPNGGSMNVTCDGSDGAGTYGVWWHISKTGRVNRGFYEPDDDTWLRRNGYIRGRID